MSDEPSGGGGDVADAGTPSAPAAQQDQSPEKGQTKEEKGTVRDKPTGIRLPGVQIREDDSDIFPDLGARGRGGKKLSREEAEAEAEKEMQDEKDSFFGRKPELKDGEAPKPPDPPPGADQKTEDPNAPKKFTFAGEEFESQEKAEQQFRSLRGMFKPLQQERDNAATVANQWKDYAESLEKRLEGKGAEPPAPQDPKAPVAGKGPGLDVDKILSGINGEMFAKIAQDPDRGLPVAVRFLAAQMLDTVHSEMLPAIRQEILEKVQGELKQGLQPVAEQKAYEEATQQVTQLFEAARGLRLDDGSEAFPELNNADTMMKVGRIWYESGLPIEHALTPRGVQQAIAMYRMQYGNPERNPKPTPGPTPQPTPRAAGASQSGTSSVNVGAGRANPESLFMQALQDADLVDPNLGFAVRRHRE